MCYLIDVIMISSHSTEYGTQHTAHHNDLSKFWGSSLRTRKVASGVGGGPAV